MDDLSNSLDQIETDRSQEEFEEEEPVSKPVNLNYLQRPPRIAPNYGKIKTQLLPKTNVSRVLLYDNVTQQQMLDMKLKNICMERDRTERLLDMHKKSFLVRQMKRQKTRTKMAQGFNEQTTVSDIKEFPALTNTNQNNVYSRRKSTFSSLPELNSHQQVGFSKTTNGVTRIFNTFHVNDDYMTVKHTKSVKDPRFKTLQMGLARLDKPSDGYVELSPSFEKDYSAISRNITRIGLVPLSVMESVVNE